jgi:tRNA A-37 threonylcarbamoyl transferase component Bud32
MRSLTCLALSFSHVLKGVDHHMASSQVAGQRNPQETERVQTISVALAETTLCLQPTGKTIQGSLNQNIQLVDQEGRLYLLRLPQEERVRRSTYEHLATTYREEGFTSSASSHRYRTIPEQAWFMNHAAQEGIRALQPVAIAHDATSMLIPFLQAEPLDEYLQQGQTEAVGAILANLTTAHHKGLILGDRWGSNTLLTPEGVVEVDFDIALEGPTAKEFDLGKLFYHLLFYASDHEQMLTYLQGYLNKNRATFSQGYDLVTVQFFIRTHMQLFGVWKTVVIDTVHESNTLPVSQEHAEQLISILQAVQGN